MANSKILKAVQELPYLLAQAFTCDHLRFHDLFKS